MSKLYYSVYLCRTKNLKEQKRNEECISNWFDRADWF